MASSSYAVEKGFEFPEKIVAYNVLNVAKSIGLARMRTDRFSSILSWEVNVARMECKLAPALFKVLTGPWKSGEPCKEQCHEAKIACFYGTPKLYFDYEFYIYIGNESAFIFDNYQFQHDPVTLNLGLLRACKLYVGNDSWQGHITQYINEQLFLKLKEAFLTDSSNQERPTFDISGNDICNVILGIQSCTNLKVVSDKLRQAKNRNNNVEFKLGRVLNLYFERKCGWLSVI